MTEQQQEQALDLLETTALMLRGMTLDPAIPEHAKGAMRSRIQSIEEFVGEALDE
jgi:hypothetical protein